MSKKRKPRKQATGEQSRFDVGHFTTQIIRRSGRNRDFLTASISRNGKDKEQIDQPIRDLAKIEEVCNKAEEITRHSKSEKTSLWKPVLIGSQFVFVGVSVYASINGLNIFNAAWLNGVTAAAFSVLSLGLFNVTIENLRRNDFSFFKRHWEAAKTGIPWLAFSVIPAIGSYIFLQEIQREQDNTGKADLELEIWKKQKSDIESNLNFKRTELPSIDEQKFNRLQAEYQTKLSKLNAPINYVLDHSRLDSLQAAYDKQLKEAQLEASTGVVRDSSGKVSGRYGGKLQALKDIESQIESERDRLSEERGTIEKHQIAARQTAIETISNLITLERESLREARQKLRESPEWQEIVNLEAKLDAHLEKRSLLELSKAEAEDCKATISKLSESTGVPLNAILLALTIAIESGAYAAALGAQLARGKSQPTNETELVEVENVQIEMASKSAWATLSRSYRQKGQEITQSIRLKKSELPHLKKSVKKAQTWCEREEGKKRSKEIS